MSDTAGMCGYESDGQGREARLDTDQTAVTGSEEGGARSSDRMDTNGQDNQSGRLTLQQRLDPRRERSQRGWRMFLYDVVHQTHGTGKRVPKAFEQEFVPALLNAADPLARKAVYNGFLVRIAEESSQWEEFVSRKAQTEEASRNRAAKRSLADSMHAVDTTDGRAPKQPRKDTGISLFSSRPTRDASTLAPGYAAPSTRPQGPKANAPRYCRGEALGPAWCADASQPAA